MRVTGFWILSAAMAFAALSCASDRTDPDAALSGRQVVVGEIDDAIGPVTKNYVHRVIAEASRHNTECIIFTIDTPGGLDASMRSIVQDILASPIPVVMFVSPDGARAASAGAIIMLAAHIAAMEPGTNMGAAHPVAMSGSMDSTMAEKVTNDAAAFSRGLADRRNRDVEWAERIVRESISSTASELLELGVIDYIADNIDDLLAQMDGATVEVEGGEVVLATKDVSVQYDNPSLREKILATIANPNIAYLLMLLGIFGIFFELQNPGAIYPGVIGGIAILLAFFSMQVLPVNYTGVALILLAVILFILEIKVPSQGMLSIGGVIAMLLGSIMFIDSPLPFMRVSLLVIAPAVGLTAAFFLFAVGKGLQAQRKKVATGGRGMKGEIGTARSDITDKGSVFVHGEYWNACADEPISKGSRVEVVSVDGLTIKVKLYNP